MRQSLLVTPAVNRPVEASTVCLLPGKENTGKEEILFIYIRNTYGKNMRKLNLRFSFLLTFLLCSAVHMHMVSSWLPTEAAYGNVNLMTK